MRIFLIYCILLTTLLGQNVSQLDMVKLAEVLRLGATELRIENVTERETLARKFPLRSAWIVSAPGHDLFFPLVIYTSRKGVINSSKYDALKAGISENPPKEGDFGYGLGFFYVDGIGECLVLMEEFAISSNRPEGVEEVLAPWRPIRENGLYIIGTIEEEGIDFGIFLPFLDEEKIGDFPDFKSMLYGPDFPNVKELSNALVTVVRDSKILERNEVREDKRGRSKLAGDDVPGGRTNPIVEGEFLSLDDNASLRPDTIEGNGWIWMSIFAALLVTLVVLWIRRNR